MNPNLAKQVPLPERAQRIASELDDQNANLDRKARGVIRELLDALGAAQTEVFALTGEVANKAEYAACMYRMHENAKAERDAALARLAELAKQEPVTTEWQPLPYATPMALWKAFKSGVKFVLHYHGKTYPVERMEPREVVVYVQPPNFPVKVYPNGNNCESAGAAIWLGFAAAAGASPLSPTVEQVEDAVCMGSGAWDTINPKEIIDAVMKLSGGASPVQPDECANTLYDEGPFTIAQPSQAVELSDEEIDSIRRAYSPQAGVDFDIRCRLFARAIIAAINAKGAGS